MVDAARSIAANTSGNCVRTRVARAPASVLGRWPVTPTRSVSRGFGGCWLSEESDGIGPTAARVITALCYCACLILSVVLNHRVALSRKGRATSRAIVAAVFLTIIAWGGRCARLLRI